ncbi:MAG: polysaccharide pyruvyl transferase CsaB [Synechococcaceae cyanobacterium]|nr:polysaccharide pyruvyl transferase CsaB [Synechococcaceae cyanobacterium]
MPLPSSPGSVRAGVARRRLRPLLCGYYGEHNLGDDALLSVLLDQLPASVRPLVTAHDQELVRSRFGVETVERRSLAAVLAALGRCDALVLGGGSLLQDATSFRSLLYYALLIAVARLRGRPALLWGQGLGPLRRRRSRLLVRALLPLVSGCSWRDPASAALARRLGGGGVVGSDPVWAFPTVPWLGSGGPIVLCWRPLPHFDAARWRPYLEALERLAVAKDRAVIWLAFHGEQDGPLLGQLEDRGLIGPALRQRSRCQRPGDPAEALRSFQQAALVLAMRLHGLILAALAGAPCAALSYDPKVAAAAAAIGCPCHDVEGPPGAESTEAIVAALLASWQGALECPPERQRIEAQRAGTAPHRELLGTWLP